MREILFRGKNTDTKQWVIGEYAINIYYICYCSLNAGKTCKCYYNEVDRDRRFEEVRAMLIGE